MRFLALEHRLPSRRVTNDEVLANVRAASARHLSPADLDVIERLTRDCFRSTGTRVRYHRADHETAAELATDAGQRALRAAGLRPLDIDLLIYVGIGRGVVEPASANVYQDMLGLRRATGFDVLDACASWLRALHLARLFLDSGTYRNIMILNAEFVGRESHRYELTSVEEFGYWHPSVTIGEAATASIVTASDQPDEFEISFRTWGEMRDLCFVPLLPDFEGHFGKEIDPEVDARPLRFVSHGLRLMEFGCRKLIEHYHSFPQFAAFAPDVVFGHAASDGMSEYVVDQCHLDRRKFRFAHRAFANTISASVPLSMSHAVKEGALSPGDRVLLLMASAGVTTALGKFVFEN
jgi:3-oxoacyl-[acyl-carrier-protein] synthase III